MNPEIEFRPGLEELAEHYKKIITLLGEDTEREGLQKTPMRVAKAMQILTRGYLQDPNKVLTDALFEEKYNQMVIVKDIDFFSMCEHHMIPFYGKVHVAYIPNGYITGLSKIAPPHGRDGCRGSKTHVHADARRGETKRHHDDERFLRSVQPSQDTRGVHEPATRRIKENLTHHLIP